jgi:hypothetical protein
MYNALKFNPHHCKKKKKKKEKEKEKTAKATTKKPQLSPPKSRKWWGL